MSAYLPTALEAAIMRTVVYADLFDYALTADEIHHYLIHGCAVPLAVIQQTLGASGYLHEHLTETDTHYTLTDRTEMVPLCMERRQIADSMWDSAAQFGTWLARLPFVQMVALTGALAVQNPPHADDDYDYMLVTQPGRVWLARAFAVALVRFGKLRGIVICPNYVVASDALYQTRQDLFMAHEVIQMIPLYGLPLYEALRETNAWVMDYLPNATHPLYPLPTTQTQGVWGMLKRGLETILSGKIGDVLEHWEHRRKQKRFKAQMQTPHSAARLDQSQIKGHFNDHGHPILQRYETRLQTYGLSACPESASEYPTPVAPRPELKMVGD